MWFRGTRLVVLVLPLALIASSCVAQQTTAPAAVDAEPALLVEAKFPQVGEQRPLGWIYAFDDAQGRKNRCVTIWSDMTWSLAEETVRGYFGDQIARSCVGGAVDAAMAPALDFPRDALEGWRTVYVSGEIAAVYQGKALPRR